MVCLLPSTHYISNMPANFCSMPAEIQLAIFEYSRSDVDGRLSAAICLISKKLSDVANSLFYRIVVLESAKSVQQFSRTLKSSPRLAKHTKHFLISDSDRRNEVLPEFVFAMARSQEQRAQRFRQLHDWSSSRDSKVKETRGAVHDILAAIGPSLQSLAILYYARYWQTSAGLEDIIQLQYPSLRELVLAGDCSLFEDGRVVSMPKMEHLHLIGEQPTLSMNMHTLTKQFPLLRNMRLNIPLISSSLQKFLHSLHEVSERTPSLTKVLLQLPSKRYTVGDENISILAQKSEKKCPILKLLVRLPDGYTYELAKREWADRTVFGGGGCWSAD